MHQTIMERSIKLYEEQGGDIVADNVKNALLITKMGPHNARDNIFNSMLGN